jgi:hypothetical protein
VIGGKSAVEVAEERLRLEQLSHGYSGGNYQGISIPIDETPKDRPTYAAQQYSQHQELKLNSTKGQWGAQEKEESAKQIQNMFGSL